MFGVILKFIPQIISLIQLAESLNPNAGQGASKLDFVTGALSAIAGDVPEAANDVVGLVNASKPLIGTIVSTMNAVGWHPAVAEAAAKFASSAPIPAPFPTAQQQAQNILKPL